MYQQLGNSVDAWVLGKAELSQIQDDKPNTHPAQTQILRDQELQFIKSKCNTNNASIITLQQVHGARSLFVENTTDSIAQAQGAAADALFTMDTGLKLVIRTADCLPLFFCFESDQHPKVLAGVIHAGWKGMHQNIIYKTLEHAHSIWVSRVKPAKFSLHFAIGPVIGKDNYEVGDEVAQRFSHFKPSLKKEGKFLLDLVSEAKDQIKRFIQPKNTTIHENFALFGCTIEKNQFYYSHRCGDIYRNQNIIEIRES